MIFDMGCPGKRSPMDIMNKGMVNSAANQNLLVISINSSFSLSSAISGSSPIPHLGQLPGPTCLISGCIGQV